MTDSSNIGQDLQVTFEEPKVALRQYFRYYGFVRFADMERRAKNANYKKGWEVRLVAKNKDELKVIRRWLKQVGLKPGKPFRNHSRFVQPIYGKKAVEWFQSED